MSIYKSLIANISEALKQSLNEMAKKTDYRTVDRNVQLSVASLVSRNRSTDCEFVKPMSKLTKQELLDRYVMGLIFLKKPCPKTFAEVEKLKSFKLYALKALALGATIDEILSLYVTNTGGTIANKVTGNTTTIKQEEPVEKPVIKQEVPVEKVPTVKPIRQRANSKEKVSKKYYNKLDEMISDIHPSMYNKIPKVGSYVSRYDDTYKACSKKIADYIKALVKKSHSDLEAFVSLLREDLQQFNKINNILSDTLFTMSCHAGHTRRGYDSYSRSIVFNITNTSYKLCLHYSKDSFYSNYEYDDTWDYKGLLKGDLTKFDYFVYRGEEPIDLLSYFVDAVYKYVVVPYVNMKKDNLLSGNSKNSQATLKKYNMSINPSSYFTWLKNNIKNILKSNPDNEISFKYHDYSGAIESFVYSSKTGKYFMDVYMQSGNSDHNTLDYLDNLLKLSSNGTYRYRYVNNDAMSYVRDTDDAIYNCTVYDLEDMAEAVFKSVKEQIEKGILS